MNRTMLSVIALAVGAVLIIGLYNIYKPQTNRLAKKAFQKVHIENMTHTTTHHYGALTYTDDNNGHVEFTKGKLTNGLSSGWWGGGFITNAPNDIKKATSIKFGDGVDTSKVTCVAGMFTQDPNIKSVDLGNNFDTSHVDNSIWGMDSMFEHDWNLEHVNLGPKFKANPGVAMSNIFDGDNKLSMPTGNISNDIKVNYNNRYTGDPKKAPN